MDDLMLPAWFFGLLIYLAVSVIVGLTLGAIIHRDPPRCVLVIALIVAIAGCAVQPVGRQGGPFSTPVFVVEYWACVHGPADDQDEEYFTCAEGTGPPAELSAWQCELITTDTTPRRPTNCRSAP